MSKTAVTRPLRADDEPDWRRLWGEHRQSRQARVRQAVCRSTFARLPDDGEGNQNARKRYERIARNLGFIRHNR